MSQLTDPKYSKLRITLFINKEGNGKESYRFSLDLLRRRRNRKVPLATTNTLPGPPQQGGIRSLDLFDFDLGVLSTTPFSPTYPVRGVKGTRDEGS